MDLVVLESAALRIRNGSPLDHNAKYWGMLLSEFPPFDHGIAIPSINTPMGSFFV